MKLQTRKVLDRSFTGLGFFSVFLLSASLIVILGPIFVRGIGAFIFKGTVEFRRLNYEQFNRGDKEDIERQMKKVEPYRKQAYEMLSAFEKQVDDEEIPNSHEYVADLRELKELVPQLLGPAPGKSEPVMMRDKYGKTRWDKAKEALHQILYMEKWDYSDSSGMGKKVLVPRIKRNIRKEPPIKS